MRRIAIIFLLLTQSVFAQKLPKTLTSQISTSVFSLSQVMMHDVVNPPAASRYYAYCMLGAYQIISRNNTNLPPLSSFIKNYKELSIDNKSKYNPNIAALYCILETGRLMLPSGYRLSEDQDKLLESFRKDRIDTTIINSSVLVAKEVATKIVAFSKNDHYNELSAKMRYRPL